MQHTRHAATALVLAFLTRSAFGVVFTLDDATRYQTIEGFGAHGVMHPWWGAEPFYNSQFLDLVIDDLGLTVSRNEYSPPGDPASDFAEKAPVLQAMKAKADASGEPLKFIVSYYTPPAAWKSNNSLVNGGTLLPEYYDEFGDYAVETAHKYDSIGIDLYALSPQNEPAFVEPYNSCVYTTSEYTEMFKVLAPTLHASYPAMRLFCAEDMLMRWNAPGNYVAGIVTDPDALAELGAFAVHNYSDGVSPTPVSSSAAQWSRAASNVATVGRPLWMTETSGYTNDWSGALTLAQAIYAALYYGKVTMWLWWQLGSPSAADSYTLIAYNTQPTAFYHACKHYFRYVRPGAQQIECLPSGYNQFAVAFVNDTLETFTMVLVNPQSDSAVADIAGANVPPYLTAFRTSDTEQFVSVGTVERFGVPLPGRSVTTLVGSYTPDPVITLLYPNGGENLVDTTVNIGWGSMGNITNVCIAFTSDDGATWDTLAPSVPNQGSYGWHVPELLSTTCRVRVSDAGGSGAEDASDALFTIQPPSIAIGSPNGSEPLYAQSTHDIQWTWRGGISLVDIDYSVDNGASWTPVAAATANDGTCPWSVPETPAATCLVRVVDADGSPGDTSDAVFSIALPTIEVMSPNGGEDLTAGTSHEIRWTSTGPVTTVDIAYSPDNGSTWSLIATGTDDDGSFAWDLPILGTDQCLVRVTSSSPALSDTSDAAFTITLPMLAVLSPNGGDTLFGGTTRLVRWSSQRISGPVDVAYSLDNGAVWSTIATGVAGTDSCSWLVPTSASDSCLVRVVAGAGFPADTSDAVFAIALPSLTLTVPNGGELWRPGSVQEVTWSHYGPITMVNIQYSADAGVTWAPVADSVPNTGTCTWTLPALNSDSCMVRIRDIVDGIPADVSDSLFSIEPAVDVLHSRLPTTNGLNGIHHLNGGHGVLMRFALATETNVSVDVYGMDGSRVYSRRMRQCPGYHSMRIGEGDIGRAGVAQGVYLVVLRLGAQCYRVPVAIR